MYKTFICIFLWSVLTASAQYPVYRQLPNYTIEEFNSYSTPGNNQQYMTGFAYSESDPSRIYMSHDVGGVWVSRDGGRYWNTLQNNGLLTRFTAGIEVDPVNKNRVFVLGACEDWDNLHRNYQGIYRSDDGGINWTRKAVRKEVGFYRRTVHLLAYAPSTKNTSLGYTERWYAAFTTYTGVSTIVGDDGFMYSDDGGETWTEVRDMDKATFTENIYGIRVDPTNKNVVYLYGGPGLMRFADATNPTGALTTISGTGGLPTGSINNEPYISADGTTIIVGVASKGIYKSTDRGVSWTEIYTYTSLVKVFVNPGFPDVMFVTSPSGGNQIRVTKDGGATWNTSVKVTPVPGYSGNWNTRIYNNFAHVIPDSRNPDRVFAQGNAMFFQSDNGGSDWVPSNGYFNGNQFEGCSFEQMFDPSDPNRLAYFAVDIGVRTTTNRGRWFDKDNFTAASVSTTTKSSNGGAIHPTKPIQLASVNSGASGKLLRSVDGGVNWAVVSTSVAKRWYIFFDQQDPTYCYQWKERSADEGATWTRLPTPGGSSGPDWVVAGVSFQDGKVIYAYGVGSPSTNVYRSTDRGDTWTLAFTSPTRLRSAVSEQFAFRVHPQNHNIVFTTSPQTGGITKWDLTDASNPTSTFLPVVTNPETGFFINRLAIDRRHPNVMYVANLRQGTGNKFFRTQDGGLTWENITVGLPGSSLGAVEVSPVTGEVIVSTPNGVFVFPPPYTTTAQEKSTMAYYTTAWSASHLSAPYDASASGQSPFGGTAKSLPGTIEAEQYNLGEKGVAYYDDYVKSGEPSYRSNDLVDVFADASASNGYYVGNTARGEWLNYTVNLAGGIYDISLKYTTDLPVAGRVRLTLNGNELGVLDLPASNAEGAGRNRTASFLSSKLTNVTLPTAPNAILQLQVLDGANINIDALDFVATVLPVRLSSFSVARPLQSDLNIAEIKWATALEEESSHFVIERSKDLIEWKAIASVVSTGNVNQTYKFVDESPSMSINYYRLKMVDLDGTFAYSSIRSLNFGKEEPDLTLYPVPAAQKIWIRTSKVSGTYTLFDSMGKTLWEDRQLPEDGIDVSPLNTGVYFIRVVQNGITKTGRFVVQN